MFLVLSRLFNILKINVYEKVFMDSVFCHSVSAVWLRNPIGMPIVYKSILAGV